MKTKIGILTFVCIIAGSLFIWMGVGDTLYVGNDVTFVVNDTRTFHVNGSINMIESTNDNFFAIRNGESILVGKPEKKPLGSSEDSYFKAALDKAPSGTWIVEKGNGITVHILSDSTVTVAAALKNERKFIFGFLVDLATLAFWLLGLRITSK
ncbi:hypothetical protein HY949_03770 [Candidatus Gottesmanbacteria bacterium]|nr:hypothetical protein [Candidatus Gottesmanbacteria bacterium]